MQTTVYGSLLPLIKDLIFLKGSDTNANCYSAKCFEMGLE